ncbi:MAG: polysaccharide deacetylase family protein [Clostridia bacterium]|nr:polysaccharide deacetylase family protein [Clostridia bacterium]
MQGKYAVLSMDVEDWYHLYYFMDKADKSYSMLDGFTNYVDLLNERGIKTTFFVLSELAENVKEQLRYAVSCGHEIACHGKTHIRPVDLSLKAFADEISDAKQKLEDIVGREVIGYRAPCYGIDNERYEIVKNIGFKYSSSKMDIKGHPLYGELDLGDFLKTAKGIYEKDDMVEFALSTAKVLGKNIAVSGGGWIRLLPWSPLMKPLIKNYLKDADTYFLYIHPFELSKVKMPEVKDSSLLNNIRARRGLGKVEHRIEQLIDILRDNSFSFTTFEDLYRKTLDLEKEHYIEL